MSLLRRGIHIASKQVYYLVIIAAVLLLSAIGTTVWLSAAIEQRKDEVAAWASEQLGYPISIGGTDLYWLDLVPKLHVYEMKIMQHDSAESILSLDHIYLGIDLLASFQQRQAVLENINITGLELGLTRTETGRFQLTGLMDALTETESAADFSSWISLLNHIDLNAITIRYQDLIDNDLSGRYQLDNAVISHSGDRWTSTVQLQPPEKLGKALVFSGELEFDLEQQQLQSWQWQLKTNEILLSALTKYQTIYGLKVEDASLSLLVNAVGSGQFISQLDAELSLQNTKLISATEPDISPVLLSSLDGVFSWENSDQGWQFSGRDVLIDMNNQRWPKTNFTVEVDSAGGVVADVDYLRLSDLSAIALLSDALPDDLRHQRPAGDVTALHLEYTPQSGINSLAMSLQDFAVLPWQDIPGITGLTAIVDWNNGTAIVDVDSHQLSLYAENLLEDAVFFDSVSGQLRWQQDLNWQLLITEFQLWNDDFTIQLDGQFEHNQGITQSDLNIKVEQVDISRWQQYVPQSLLDVDFKEWSDSAFVAGTIVDGDISLTGNLAAFPFEAEPDQGQFDMVLNVEGLQLHYGPGWPDIIDVTGSVNGHNNLLKIYSEQGTISGFNFVKVQTNIDKYLKGKPILTVDGSLTGTTQQALDFLQQSPLQQRFGNAVESVSAQGTSDIQLQLMVPLADVDNTETSGFVSFENSEFSYPDFANAAFTQVEGKLEFNNDGVSATDIKALLLDQQVTVDVEPLSTETLITIKGNVTTDNIATLSGQVVPDFISGNTAYKALLKVYEKQLGDFELDASLESDLKGIMINLPAPLGKNTEQALPLNLSVEHYDNELAYAAVYGNQLNAIMMPTSDGQWRGELRFGQGKAVLPKSGLAIKGQLDRLSIADWLAWQSVQPESNNQSLIDKIDIISMNIGQLDAYQQHITKLAFTAERAAQDWRISLYSDQIKGNIILPLNFASETPLTMDFDYLNLTLPKQNTGDAVIEDEQVTDRVTSLWPSINFHTNHLQIDEMKFGELNLQASRHETSWVINAALLKSTTINASIKGQWQLLPTGSVSNFQLSASSEDVQGLFADLGYQQVLDADNIDIDLELTWQDSPLGFSLADSTGQFHIDMGKGRLLDIEPGAAGRIFGLLSVATIPRRLALDFTDLFGKGFSFDDISGNFSLQNGIAYTDDLIMKGQPATIKVTGDVNLVNKTYDQKIKIIPNVSSTLPVAGAVAGGPIGLGVGTAILIFDKLAGELFDKQIVNLISYSYRLSGPWHEPELNTFNASTN
ncbi:TIGR02099 family protein [Methylophaga sp. 41_12_T18]|nr:TIGR02099 family protein [Methylophaga sp. 41_12_T18]